MQKDNGGPSCRRDGCGPEKGDCKQGGSGAKATVRPGSCTNREGDVMAKNRRRRTGLTAAEVRGFQRLLLQKREEILGNVRSMEDEALKRQRTDLPSCPVHMGDVGSDTFAVENALDLADRERTLLREIDEALARIEEGTYGICLGTGKPIGQPRLEAILWAKYSVEYAGLWEKGVVSVDGADDEASGSQVTAALTRDIAHRVVLSKGQAVR